MFLILFIIGLILICIFLITGVSRLITKEKNKKMKVGEEPKKIKLWIKILFIISVIVVILLFIVFKQRYVESEAIQTYVLHSGHLHSGHMSNTNSENIKIKISNTTELEEFNTNYVYISDKVNEYDLSNHTILIEIFYIDYVDIENVSITTTVNFDTVELESDVETIAPWDSYLIAVIPNNQLIGVYTGDWVSP